jgi:hypothetical protein
MFNNDDNFLKSFNLNSNKFFNGYIPLKDITYCVVIIYENNYRKEVYGIKNPWQMINGLKKNPKVKSCYIKDENMQ